MQTSLTLYPIFPSSIPSLHPWHTCSCTFYQVSFPSRSLEFPSSLLAFPCCRRLPFPSDNIRFLCVESFPYPFAVCSLRQPHRQEKGRKGEEVRDESKRTSTSEAEQFVLYPLCSLRGKNSKGRTRREDSHSGKRK